MSQQAPLEVTEGSSEGSLKHTVLTSSWSSSEISLMTSNYCRMYKRANFILVNIISVHTVKTE